MKRSGLACWILALVFALPAGALEPAEVVALHRAGVGDAVILEQLRATGVPGPLAAADLLRLHEAGITPEVIREMIRLGRPPAPDAVPAGKAVIRLTNEDTDRYCVLEQPGEGRLVLYAGSSQINPTLSREETRDFVVAPGTWHLTWMGESDGVTVDAAAGRIVQVITRNVEYQYVRVLHADVYDRDRFVVSRTLRVFPLYYVPKPSAPACPPVVAPYAPWARAADPGAASSAPAGAAPQADAGTPAVRTPYQGERVTGYVEK